MKIKITDKKTGLKVGQEYDLCEMAAHVLIKRGEAVISNGLPQSLQCDRNNKQNRKAKK